MKRSLKKYVLCFCVLPLTVITCFAQDKSGTYWKEKPELHTIPAEYAKESSVVAEEHTSLVYKDGDDKQVWVYRTIHRVVKIQDDKGIEDFNKMSVSVLADQVLVELKARTILANGKVIDVAKDKMKESKAEGGGTDIVFAMDGVEKNAEVELLMSYKKPAVLFGREMFQYSVPIVHSTFELTCPPRIKFEEKGYNGFPTVHDTVNDGVRYIYIVKDSVPAIHDESYAFYEANRMRCDYKVSYLPEEKESVRMFTWQDMVKKLYANNYESSDKENKAVEKFVAGMGITKSDNDEDKIKKIETAIKNGITLYKDLSDEDAWKLDNIIAKKSATESGLLRLFAACFVNAGIKHELGMTTNRNQGVLDPEFENWNSMENYVIYFPDQKKFLSPTAMYYRYPFTATDVINNKGVFCKLTTIGDLTNAIADIRNIPALPATESHNDIIANISFTPDMEAKAEVSYIFSGYCAMGLREAIILLPKDKVKEMVKGIAALADKPEDLLKYTITGEAFDNFYTNKPLEIATTIKAPLLMEKAGPKYLFRLGDVIGRQSELYQATERKQPIDLDYPHYLKRTITVNIPEGYKVLNPETIKIQVDYKDESGKVTTAFYSDYKMDGNKLIVEISEFYSQLHYPVSGFEPFRKVINASADFNKVTLLLGKI